MAPWGFASRPPPVPRSPTWDEQDFIEGNYERMGFAADVNLAHGRNARGDALAARAAALADAGEEPAIDEDLAVAMAQQRASGKAPPKRPTPRQRAIVARLVAAHGDDVAAMVRDRKLNAMQHSTGQLQALIQGCEYWEGKTGVDFRVPNKSLW